MDPVTVYSLALFFILKNVNLLRFFVSIKGAVMQNEKALINHRLCVSKVS